MKAYTIIAVVLASVSGVAVSQPAERESTGNSYAGIGLGTSGFDLRDASTPALGSDLRSQALKLYWGYEFGRHLGVEVGYVRTGELSETRVVAGESVMQTARSRAGYAAVTGRIDLVPKFAVTGRIGVAYGDVNGLDAIGGGDSIFGRRASVMGGFGALYHVNERMSVALDIDYIGRESSRVSAGTFTLTARRRF